VNATPILAGVELAAILKPANRRDALADALRNLGPRQHAA